MRVAHLPAIVFASTRCMFYSLCLRCCLQHTRIKICGTRTLHSLCYPTKKEEEKSGPPSKSARSHRRPSDTSHFPFLKEPIPKYGDRIQRKEAVFDSEKAIELKKSSTEAKTNRLRACQILQRKIGNQVNGCF